MSQFYRRIPELVSASQWQPGRKVKGVFVAKPHRGNSYPAVTTDAGPWSLSPGDWVVEHADGAFSVMPDELFRMAYEPV